MVIIKESYVQGQLKQKLEEAGFLVWIISDRFTAGIPDIYCAKDGEDYWLELKVTNKKPGQTIHLDNNKSSERGFSRIQAVKLFELKEQGMNAAGVIYFPLEKEYIKIPPEDLDKSYTYSEIREKYPRLDLI